MRPFEKKPCKNTRTKPPFFEKKKLFASKKQNKQDTLQKTPFLKKTLAKRNHPLKKRNTL